MKQLTAIWFSLLLVLAQIAPVSMAASTPNCCKPATSQHVACCAQMPCCAAKPVSSSEPAPVPPVQSGSDTQVSLVAPATALWDLPGHEANAFSSTQSPSIASAGTPLFARHCVLLL